MTDDTRTDHAPVSPDDEDAADHGEKADQAYLDRVRHEIDEEVRRRRAAGDFPPSFERKLDELFARFTPTGTHDDQFTDALKLADRSAYFDAQVPFGSRRRPQGFTKWVLWQAEAWFVNYVVRQLNHFSASIMRVVHLLDERIEEVEREVDMLVDPGTARRGCCRIGCRSGAVRRPARGKADLQRRPGRQGAPRRMWRRIARRSALR